MLAATLTIQFLWENLIYLFPGESLDVYNKVVEFKN